MAVETVLGRKWRDFAEEYGDAGRDMTIYIARLRCGLTLGQIGGQLGGLDYKLVSSAAERFRRRMKTDTKIERLVKQCLSTLENNET